jgi:hypothetical protein
VTLGTIRLVPVASDVRLGWWVLRVESSGG